MLSGNPIMQLAVEVVVMGTKYRCRQVMKIAILLGVYSIHGVMLPLTESVPNSRADATARDEPDLAPGEWAEVAPADVVRAFQMLATQTRGNYERIKTWQAKYALRTQRSVAQGETVGFRADLVGVPMRQEIKYQLQVSIDLSAGAIFRDKTETALKWINADTLAAIDIPNTAVPNERVIVTSEHCLHMKPHQTYGSFQAVPDHPAARNKRAAFRDAIESTKVAEYLSMPDPRQCYGRSPNRRFWEDLELDIATLQGKHGEEKAARLRSRLRVYQAPGKGGTWYREDLVMDGPGGMRNSAQTLWSPDAGFHPVSFTLWQDEARTQLLTTTTWSFKQVDGIYVPESIKETYYRGEKIDRLKELHLQECVLNRPIDASQFSYAGLGLKDGELIMDRIEGVCYILTGGTPEKLASFEEQYLPRGVDTRNWPLRWLVAGIVLAVIFVLVAITRRKAANARRMLKG